MAKYLNLTCSNLDRGDHNKIADALSASANVLNWNAPQDGQFLLKCTDGTSCGDIIDTATVYSNIRSFVTPFDPESYSYRIRSDWCDTTDSHLAAHAQSARKAKQLKCEAEEAKDISLKAGFNHKALNLPNGVRIEISETGEITIQEAGASAKKVRASDQLMKNLIT